MSRALRGFGIKEAQENQTPHSLRPGDGAPATVAEHMVIRCTAAEVAQTCEAVG